MTRNIKVLGWIPISGCLVFIPATFITRALPKTRFSELLDDHIFERLALVWLVSGLSLLALAAKFVTKDALYSRFLIIVFMISLIAQVVVLMTAPVR